MKRKIYIFLVMVFVAMFVFYIYLDAALITFNQSGFDLLIFWPMVLTLAVLLGIFLGFFLGRSWWKFVYIDNCGGRFKKK